jgi:hypothetical protein
LIKDELNQKQNLLGITHIIHYSYIKYDALLDDNTNLHAVKYRDLKGKVASKFSPLTQYTIVGETPIGTVWAN